MEPKQIIKYAAVPCKIILVVFVFVALIMFLQSIIPPICAELIAGKTKQQPVPKRIDPYKDNIAISSMKKFLPDGTVHLLMFEPTVIDNKVKRIKQPEQMVKIYDANEKLLWAGQSKDKPFKYIESPTIMRGQFNFDEWIWTGTWFSRTLVMPVLSDEKKVLQQWVYNPSGYFTGYADGNVIGYAGAQGFVSANPEKIDKIKQILTWMSGSISASKVVIAPKVVIQADNSIYEFDFENHTGGALLNIDQEIKYFKMSNWFEIDPNFAEYRPAIFVSTNSDTRYIVLREPNEVKKFRHPEFTNKFDHLVFLSATQDSIYFLEFGNNWPDNPIEGTTYNSWRRLYKVGSSENLNQIGSFTWSAKMLRLTHWQSKWESILYNLWRYDAYASPVAFQLLPRYTDASSFENDMWRALREQMQRLTPESKIVQIMIAGILAVLVLLHGIVRFNNKSGLVFWIVFTLMFSVAGFLTYMALNHSPVIRCASCGRRRQVQTDICQSCGAPLSQPEHRSTDLILPSSACQIADVNVEERSTQ